MRILVVAGLLSVASLVACGGAVDPSAETPSSDASDLSSDFDTVGQGMTADVDPSHEATGEHDHDCRDEDGRPKHGHRKHHLFKWLDRLDGDKDHRIVIASLPAKVPAGIIEKLHAIDADKDGVVTKKEARHRHKHGKHHQPPPGERDHDGDHDDDGPEPGEHEAPEAPR
jgi:hypothetical protein